MTLSPALWAGAYIFAGESNGVDLILHPTGYTGSGGVLNVGVCIDPNSLNKDDLVIPVRNNIAVWNELQPVASNRQSNVLPSGYLDAESVLLHELGHCIGLAHVNAASESGLPQNDYTKATDGANNSFDVNAGPDGVIGSHDDIRGDDVNLHWFNPANDPFLLPIPTPVDTTVYKRDISNLPFGDSFAQNGSRSVAAAMGYPPAEAVMQQGTYYRETQRELTGDGAATVRLAASGVDERAGTGDDYQLVLTYEGIATGSQCDITVIMENMSGLAYCSVGGAFIGGGHARITSASIHLGAGYNYVFNTELRGGGNQPPVADNDSANVNEDGAVDIAVLANDNDPDGDGLSVSAVGNPPNGSTSVNGDDTIRYTPDANYNGADSFSYTVSDGKGGSDSATVNVTVTPLNDQPVAQDDGATTPFESPIDIDVLGNDSDVDGDDLSVSAVADPPNGSTSVNADNTVRYTPESGFHGNDSFVYDISDGNGGGDSATVTVTVQPPNQAPTASFTYSCSGLSCSFDGTDSSDPDGSVIAYDWNFGDGNGGSGPQPSHSYAAPGTYTVVLTVEDNQLASDDASASVTVTAGPDVAVADWSTVDGSVSGSYLATHSRDGTVQSITETHSGGKPSLRHDSLEHIWQFVLTAGHTTFNVDATAEFPGGDADTTIDFEWSNSPSGPWTPMVTLYAGSSELLSYDTESAAGTVYVRVADANSATGNTVYSMVRVDHMYFDGTPAGPPPPPPEAKELLVAIALGTVNAGQGNKLGQAVVTVTDDLGSPVGGVAVGGTFSGSYNESGSAVSSGSGDATLTTVGTDKGGISFTFCVDSISGSSLTYAGPDCATF
jgi:hypothetical protein